ncbi:MAG: flagellar motor protein MotB [Sulfurimonas sp. RIFOXYD12_FULL_33_39]|uniref:OmpA/MotB family protein n=1 Tax=unclassified Sulfurimonas TaxID=2623549 RepID=UPI0008B85DAC|nr:MULTISPECIES: flagellar motor protein MotB [unclassified Sulfurimonas]OHE07466.1 MAG: flagellar motor protein MotB [Sulfurimonas sp. RIFCSPLOWO2_12_FULL_34_6]OHE09504.1 MAG: flagellar motor protein MotB [Sulfurimonas sp. RIFOXYD12_FULL_33_39]OHE12715.1 MAG: flagellar motor protein MotB [Sulfurimonas sp. RIFOXYD2_FULL_34_21]DAB28596.1 MAG TPA: flagellar motor protein MotB [Sulfurimonas sp. UBA10385]
MAKNKCPDCPTCMPEWLAAFGDLMSLLLCFFVLLLSMSSMDAKKVSEAIGSLSGAMSVLEGGVKTEVSKQRIQESTPIEVTDETSEQVNRVAAAIMEANEMMGKGQESVVSLEEAQDGFVIELPASLLFKSGSAVIQNEDALLFLKRIALIVGELPNETRVSVHGHTDNQGPGSNSPFKDNWELSSARAISVLQELLLDGVDPKRINAAGFAEFSPKATNVTEVGREKNRRVELHFFGAKPEDKSKVKQTVLDKAAQK